MRHLLARPGLLVAIFAALVAAVPVFFSNFAVSLMNDVGRQRTFLMVCVMTLGWTGPVTAGLLALAVGGSGGAIVVAMGAGLGLTMAAGLGGRSLAWRRLRRAAADLDVDVAMLQQALVLVERDGIDGAVALQQVLHPPAVGPSPAA